MFCSKIFKKINPALLLFLFSVLVLSSLFLSAEFASAAGIWDHCQGPLVNYDTNYGNDQFDCNNSDPNTYTYYCEETASQLAYCRSFVNPSSDYYDCGMSTDNMIATSTGFLFVNCSLVDINPGIISASATPISSSRIDVSWATTGIIAQQKIERQIRIGSNLITQMTTWLSSIPRDYSDSGLTGNASYRYIITVYNGVNWDNEFAFATTPSDSTPPSNITNLSVSSCSFASCSLSWTASTDDVGGSGLGGYRIYRDGTQVGTAAANATTHTDPGLSSLTSYSYYIVAYDNAGNSSSQSNTVIGTTTAEPDTTAPSSASPNLQASRDATNPSSQINISWNAYTDNVGVIGYRIERCQGAGCLNFVQIGTSVAASYSDSGLSPSTSYSYRIRAYDAANNLSTYSNIASATTAAPPDTLPPVFTKTAPADLLASGTLSTNLSGSTNELAVCRWADSAGQPFSSMNQMNPVSGGMNHAVSITTLADGQSYYVKCRDTAPTPNISGDFLVFSVDSPIPDTSPPQISNPQPSGTLAYFPSGSGTVAISVVTNKDAYCKYSINSNTDFDSMADWLGILPGRNHSSIVTVSNGSSYAYYVRCQDSTGGYTNDSDYPITFSVGTAPNILPTVNLTADPTSGNAPLQVNVSGSGNDSDGDFPLIYSLDWGDGFSEGYNSGSSVQHTYNNVGSYVITLTVVDTRGGRASAIQPITVNAPQVVVLPPITGGICAVECNDDNTCVNNPIYGAGFVCGPSHICIPAVALDNGLVRSGGYASLTDGSQNQPADRDNGNVAVFNAGATSVIIGLQTEIGAQSDCRYYISEEPGSNNPITGVAFNNTQFMRPLSTQDFINHYQTLTGLRNGNYTLNVRCQNTSTLAVNTIDYPISFNIGGPELLACVPGEICPSGLPCSSVGRCEPAPYTCLINQYFIRNNIPYLLDICFPSLAT